MKFTLYRRIARAVLFAVLLGQVAYAQDSLSMQAMHNNTEASLKEYPVLWQQTAAEYRALCYQAFNIAMLRLNEIPKNKLKKGGLAIITDLDETILDNSYVYGQLIKNGKDYSAAAWKEWTEKSSATGVPGSVDFLQKAHEKGITVFYISNRDTSELRSTLVNLKRLQLPNADMAHLLFLSNTSSKEARRQIVMGKYNVAMLLGDNLNDFMQVFEKRPIEERNAEVDKTREQWGKKFIVLPNATYGEWENALYDYEKTASPQQRENKRNKLLKGY
jgi:5'-nucleotidase (lipoprotein e(P4) family)